jgi:hypothetical protein
LIDEVRWEAGVRSKLVGKPGPEAKDQVHLWYLEGTDPAKRQLLELDQEWTLEETAATAASQVGTTPLSDRQRDILGMLHKENAFDVDHRRTTKEIVEVVAGHGRASADSFKRPIADLRRRGLIETKEGSEGGCWLTTAGRKSIQTRQL